ncbi:MAG: 6-carboxytetrahydropterin synthase QueD [Chloroflexi bacterium]|nr:6-carboxytetrahydropterin synthase QueD [Chloroflexota bacterium]
MFELKVKRPFNAAHFLRGYDGKCENLHGHGYIVQICVRGQQLNETGYITDFTALKAHLNEVLAALDHTCLNEITAFKEQNPTAENIAKYIYDQINSSIEMPAYLHSVKVWETPEQSAKYTRD